MKQVQLKKMGSIGGYTGLVKKFQNILDSDPMSQLSYLMYVCTVFMFSFLNGSIVRRSEEPGSYSCL